MNEILARIASSLIQKNASITCAESCTGGLLSAAFTELSGSSKWFNMGFVTYSNESKRQLLGVTEQVLDDFGAVSLETVAQMAKGALTKASAQYALAISGVAGPTGGSVEKPVGTVCFALTNHKQVISTQIHFDGDRQSVRAQSVDFVLGWLDKQLQQGF